MGQNPVVDEQEGMWCCGCCGALIDEVALHVGVEPHRLAAWRDEFLEAGNEDLKGR